MEDLKKMWERQRKCDEEINGLIETHEEKQKFTKEIILHLIVEANEILNEINWKHHRKEIFNKNNPVNVANIREEIIDVFKYLIIIAQMWGMTPETFIEEFNRKSEVVEQRYKQEKKISLLKDTKVICIDIDGVLAEYPRGFLDFIERETGKKISAVTYDLYSEVGQIISEEKVKELKHKFRTTGEKRFLPVIVGSKDALLKLKIKGYTIVLLSARPVKQYPRIFADTIEWLKANDLIYDAIIWDEKKEEKIMQEFPKMNFMVEDNGDNALKVAKKGFKVYLFDKTYNQNTRHENIIRVKSWEEILNYEK
jgi:uncharacterized HAD superfamily protein/NTP pyrophosphatase (non-canonical NTP hydrolase)